MIKQVLMAVFLAMPWVMVGCKSNENNKTSTSEVLTKPEVKPSDTLFQKATIPDEMPEFIPKKDSGRTINDGYWRQFEFVSKVRKQRLKRNLRRSGTCRIISRLTADLYLDIKKWPYGIL